MTTATTTRYVVEKIERADRYGFGPEVRNCEDFPSLKAHWEDLAGRDTFDAHAEAGQLVQGEVDVLEHTDPETGDEVTARRA